MDDQYRIDDGPAPHQSGPTTGRPAAAPPGRTTDTTDVALWIALVCGVLLNVGFQAGTWTILSGLFGLIAVGAGIALIVRRVKRRR